MTPSTSAGRAGLTLTLPHHVVKQFRRAARRPRRDYPSPVPAPADAVPPREDGRRLRYRHRREELLQAATEHVVAEGLAQASLRRVAEGVGVSHAALLHHFGTREDLLAEIVERVLTRAFSAPGLHEGDPDGPLRALWRHATAEPGRRHVRLFLAVTGQALYDEGLAATVSRSVRERTDLIAAGFAAAGADPATARSLGTLVLSTMRGLLLDRLVTGDTDRVDAAFELFVRGLETAYPRRS
ncbi:TetR family transcriptional regulator [Kineococcus rhizosphaerae]|uniref:TetR family transcriptional regulator n=1 Tax=Kineococcus rhizosphaerae TaxID=559628 RepID=A0A2T0R1X8_9ACTN|nr:TetR family transcriptional regulator [Kineococcus rhizosphaerae]